MCLYVSLMAYFVLDCYVGTPVTEETFKAWKEAKEAKKQADAVARMKAEEKKKGKGKGCE